MKIKISADSTCDLTAEQIAEYNVGIIPLYINKGEESLKDGIEITPADIFKYVDSGAGVCSTSAVNVADYLKFFEGYLKEYDAVIHINLSSKMSSCYQNACIAASELENVYVVDSQNLSTASGHLVIDAALMAKSGMAPADIADELNSLAGKLEASFVLDTLMYLYKGGRCSGIAALGANLMKLRPCIEVRDGTMGVGKKYRGNIDKVLVKYVEDRLKDRDDIDYRRIFITNSGGIDESVFEAIRDTVKKYGKFEVIMESVAGCTISNHCGPKCFGILFYRK